MVISGAGALFLASALSWEFAYTVMSLCVGIGIVTILFCPEPQSAATQDKTHRSFAEHMDRMVVQPLANFVKTQPQWLLILVFVVLYKLGDAFMGNMLHPFYYEMGFSIDEIAGVTKVFGVIPTLVGGFVGGVLVFRVGMFRALLICGILQILANLIFILLAFEGHNVALLMASIGAENFTTGMGSVAFVAYLSSLCSIEFTASQYAILSALGTTGRTFFSSSAGLLAEHSSWPIFFLVSGMIALPGIFVLLWLMRKTPDNETNLDALGSTS
jgi:PAT family beta-lactamase induction signal transducer AmpG